jgi:hypothetical protein
LQKQIISAFLSAGVRQARAQGNNGNEVFADTEMRFFVFLRAATIPEVGGLAVLDFIPHRCGGATYDYYFLGFHNLLFLWLFRVELFFVFVEIDIFLIEQRSKLHYFFLCSKAMVIYAAFA